MTDDKDGTVEEKFATTTTLHGVQYIATSKVVFVKLIWLLIFLGGVGVCTWQIVLRINEYREFNVITEINLTFVSEMDFPAVTICNFNRYRESLITEEERDIITYLWEAEDYDYYSESNPLDYSAVFGGEPFNTSEFTLRTGFKLDSETVKFCKWLDKTCSAANFTHIFTSYGNCYTFNSGDGDTLLKVKQPGAGNGLQMLIDIEQDQYTETMAGNIEAGLKILVHDQDEPPLIESRGIAIPPGFHAFTSSKRVLVSNLEDPHGECDTSRTLEYYDVYTLSGCYIECRLRRILRICHCRPIRYPGSEIECTPKQTAGCAKDVLTRIKNGSLEACDCPVPCEYTSYDTSVNYALIPSESVREEMISKYGVNESYMTENFVLLDVYYEDLNYQAYKQKPAMTFSALLSDVGGQLGLFIGASVLTFAELGQYILQKFHAIFQSSNRSSRLRSSNVTPIRDNHKIGIDNQSLELS